MPYGFPNYPDGLLLTTVADLGRLAAAMIKGKDAKGSVLKPATLAQMCTGIVPTAYPGIIQGLGWYQVSAKKHPTAWGHDGCDPGVRTQLVVDFNLGRGVIFFTNCGVDLPEAEELLKAVDS